MPRPHPAALIEDAYHERIAGRLRDRGWKTRVLPHMGYGSVASIRVFGRVVMSRLPLRVAAGTEPSYAVQLRSHEEETRGWRAFVAAPAIDVPVTVTINERVIEARTDRGGYIDVTVRGHGLAPGWQSVRLSSPDALSVEAPVLVVGTRQTFGIISDIDDTVLSTSLPRPFIAAWNTFVKVEGARKPVPGMATFYREMLAANPGAPVIYLSTGAWNTMPGLVRFLRRSGFPVGPMLLTDWGPTNTGFFRSGQDHKRASLHRLARELPHVQWLLIGDDGQNDPKIYTEFASKRPDRVRGIVLRQLSTGEQVLSHGIPVAIDDLAPAPTDALDVPVVRATDGYGLARLVRPLWESAARGATSSRPTARRVARETAVVSGPVSGDDEA